MNTNEFRQDEIARMEPHARMIINNLGLTNGNHRQDADALAWTVRELLMVKRTVYEVQYPELMGMTFVPPDTEVTDPGASHFTYRYQDRVGKARLAGAMPRGNIPRSDITVSEETPIEIQSIVMAYGWNLQEVRAAVLARRSLTAAKAVATRKAMMHEHDDIILLGDGTSDYKYLRGLFKLSGTVSYAVPNGDSGAKTFESKTGMEIVATLHGLCNAIQTNSNGVEQPSHIILPLTSYTTAIEKRIGDGSSVSALDYFIAQRKRMTGGKFQDVQSSVKLETAGSGSTKRAVAYDRDASKVFRVDPVEYEEMPPQTEDFETVVNCHARTAGVTTPYPKSIAYGDGI